MNDIRAELEAVRSWLADSEVQEIRVTSYLGLVAQMLSMIPAGVADINSGHGRIRVALFPLSQYAPELVVEYCFFEKYFVVITITCFELDGDVVIKTVFKAGEQHAMNYWLKAFSTLQALAQVRNSTGA